jgi:hypothetical protein
LVEKLPLKGQPTNEILGTLFGVAFSIESNYIPKDYH